MRGEYNDLYCLTLQSCWYYNTVMREEYTVMREEYNNLYCLTLQACWYYNTEVRVMNEGEIQ